MIGSIINGFGNIIGTIGSIGAQNKANDIAQANLDYNKDISERNLQFQKDSLAYQQALNQLQMEREDTTYARTVADMRASGLSPLAMSGTNSAGSLSSGSAPQQEQVDATNLVNSVISMASTFGQLGQVMSGIQRTDAETQYIKAQAESQILDNRFKLDTWDSRLDDFLYSSKIKKVEHSSKSRENTLNAFYGLTSLMPDIMKQYIMSQTGEYWTNIRAKDNMFDFIAHSDSSLVDFGRNILDSYSYDTQLKKHQSEWSTTNDILSLLGQIFGLNLNFRK